MLGLFAPKPTHPLADDARRQEVLEQLNERDAIGALGEAAEWLKSLAADDSLPFTLRARYVRQLEDVSRRHTRIATRTFLTMAHLSEAEDVSLWRATRDFWSSLGGAYHSALRALQREAALDGLSRGELARFLVRLLRAYGERQRWDQYRYWPTSEAMWQIVGRAWRLAAERGVDRRLVSAHHGDRRQTTVEREYLRLLMFHVSASDALLPFEVEVVESCINAVLARIELSADAARVAEFAVDPGERRAPQRRVEGVEISPEALNFSAERALVTLHRLRETAAAGRMPGDLHGLRHRSPRVVLPVIEHLIEAWSPAASARGYSRYRVRSAVAVVDGLAAAHRRLLDPHLDVAAANWSVSDVSIGGMRVAVPPQELQPSIGRLLGLRPAGGENWLVGLVRRLARDADGNLQAGLETLSKHPLAAQRAGDGPVILLDAPDLGEPVRALLPTLAFDPDQRLDVVLLGQPVALAPDALIERGPDFDLARYRVVG